MYIFDKNNSTMKFIYVAILLLFFSCGPTEKEKEEIEKEIVSIKANMLNLMKESSDLVIDIDDYKTNKNNIQIGETLLKEVSRELNEVSPGSDEEKNLKIKEEKINIELSKQKESLKSKGDINLMENQLQAYGTKYDSLEKLLKEKTQMIK